MWSFKKIKMKKGVHPENYRFVAFKDMSNDDVFITKSTANTKETAADGTNNTSMSMKEGVSPCTIGGKGRGSGIEARRLCCW